MAVQHVASPHAVAVFAALTFVFLVLAVFLVSLLQEKFEYVAAELAEASGSVLQGVPFAALLADLDFYPALCLIRYLH